MITRNSVWPHKKVIEGTRVQFILRVISLKFHFSGFRISRAAYLLAIFPEKDEYLHSCTVSHFHNMEFVLQAAFVRLHNKCLAKLPLWRYYNGKKQAYLCKYYNVSLSNAFFTLMWQIYPTWWWHAQLRINIYTLESEDWCLGSGFIGWPRVMFCNDP